MWDGYVKRMAHRSMFMTSLVVILRTIWDICSSSRAAIFEPMDTQYMETRASDKYLARTSSNNSQGHVQHTLGI